jgi:Cof subfamily protein (haloacid dehalogenase superfamily)
VTVRLVATDLDGTLLRSDGTVAPRTRAAIDAATAAGLTTAFVTGRPPRWLDDVIEGTGHQGMAVGANGAVLYDLASGQAISMHLLAPAILATLTAELRAAFPDAAFAVEYSDGFAAEAGYVHDWEINPRTDRHGQPIPPPVIADLATLVSRPGMKLLAKDRAVDPDLYRHAAGELLAGRASVTSSSAYGLLEIGSPGITKATGLAELATRLGVRADEVVAIGDMPNDVPMLEWAGRSYAVANAHDAAKAAADEVVGSNDDDAVAVLIESLLADR